MSRKKKFNPYRDYAGTAEKWPAVPGVGDDVPSQSRSAKPGDAYAGTSLPIDNPLRFDATASRTPRDFSTDSEPMSMGGKSKFLERDNNMIVGGLPGAT